MAMLSSVSAGIPRARGATRERSSRGRHLDSLATMCGENAGRGLSPEGAGIPRNGAVARQWGITLIELVIVLAVAASLVLIGGASLLESKARSDVLACAQGLSKNIRLGRRIGMARGTRTLLVVSRGEGPMDVSGDGSRRSPGLPEFYAVGLDNDASNSLSIPRRDFLVKQGTPGDTLCNEDIKIDSGTSLPRRKLVFSSMGTLKSSGAANSNIYFKKRGQVARLEVTSITGKTKVYINMPAYKDCNGGVCRPSSSCPVRGGCWQEVL